MENRPFSSFFVPLFWLIITTAATACPLSIADNIFPENIPGSFELKEEKNRDIPTVSITLNSSLHSYSILTPLDADQRPDCQELQKTIAHSLHLPQESLHAHCRRNKRPTLGVTLQLTQHNNDWRLSHIDWNNGWLNISTAIITAEAVNKDRLQNLLGAQARLLETSGKLAREFPGLGTSPESLPVTLWQWLAGSRYALLNGAFTSWHGYEVISHSLEVASSIQNRHWGHLGLGVLSLAFHVLEGLEHADQTALGNLAHLDFHSDIINASPLPHATNISLAGAALLLNLVEMYHDHGHQPAHTSSHHSSFHSAVELLGYLHTSIHIYELWEAVAGWLNGEEPHGHSHGT